MQCVRNMKCIIKSCETNVNNLRHIRNGEIVSVDCRDFIPEFALFGMAWEDGR